MDTGSPFSMFGLAVAEAIGIDMSPGAGFDRSVHVLGGIYTARMATVMLDLPPFEGLSWDAEVGFLGGNLDLSFAGVLGQEGFLDHWVASFNLYDGYFVIEERDSFHERLPIDPFEVYQSQRFDSEWDRPAKF